MFDGDPGLVHGDYPRLYGPENSGTEVLNMWREYNPLFQQAGLNISSLVLNERRAWQIILDNGIRLELGKESISERIKRFLCCISILVMMLKRLAILISDMTLARLWVGFLSKI